MSEPDLPVLVGTISAIDGTVTGALSLCDVQNLVSWNKFSDDYQLSDLTIGQSVILNLSSNDFDTYLELVNADTQEVIVQDDNSGIGNNSVIIFTPDAGINYLVRASSYDEKATGSYTLGATAGGGADLAITDNIVAPEQASIGRTFIVSWTGTNQGEVAASGDWGWYDTIYVSDDTVLDDRDTPVGLWAWVNADMRDLAPGESYTEIGNVNLPSTKTGNRYLLFVADIDDEQAETDETNNSLAVPIEVNPPPQAGKISTIDGTVTGALSEGDVNNLDGWSNRFSDDYQLSDLTIGQSVTLNLCSADFDTYLELVNADTQEVIASDNNSGRGTDSLISFTPDPGINYVVRASSYGYGDATGSYTLSVIEPPSNLILIGTDNSETLTGSYGNDTITGHKGNDSLMGGGNRDTFTFSLGDGQDTIADFAGVGRGIYPYPPDAEEVDTLKFVGAGFTAQNMLLDPDGSDLLITFEGMKDTSVRLEDFALENLDNLSKRTGASMNIGNVLFDGQNSVKDSFDVFYANQQRPTVFRHNSVTFLNDLNNNTNGFDNSDDVINSQGGNDYISGLSGDDLLRGGTGNDTLSGGAGNDTLADSSGNNLFVLAANTGTDTITHFSAERDLIGLSGGLASAELAIAGGTGEHAQDTFISLTSNNQLLAILSGVEASTLTSTDFTIV